MTPTAQLGDTNPAVQLGGVHALAGSAAFILGIRTPGEHRLEAGIAQDGVEQSGNLPSRSRSRNRAGQPAS